MRVMAVDIGTCSTLHLIADVEGGRIHLLERGIAANRLGADIGDDGCIGGELLTHNRDIIARLVLKSYEMGCDTMGGVGTYALRNAGNANQFIQMAVIAGLPLEVITTSEEASLAWQGVFGIAGPDRPTVLLDVGGGSSEIITGRGSPPDKIDSIPLGAVTAARNWFKNDPPLPAEISALVQAVTDRFAKWIGLIPSDSETVAIAGTAVSLVAIRDKILSYSDGAYEGAVLTAAQVREWRERLLGLTETERRALPGMSPIRAGSIHAGALILDVLMTKLGWATVRVSERGVLFGVARRLAECS